LERLRAAIKHGCEGEEPRARVVIPNDELDAAAAAAAAAKARAYASLTPPLSRPPRDVSHDFPLLRRCPEELSYVYEIEGVEEQISDPLAR